MKTKRRLTLEHYYDYLNNDHITDEQMPLRGIDIDDLQAELDKLPADVMERLSVCTHVHKIHQGLFRLTPDPGIKKRPILTGMQRITAEASTTKEKSKKGYYDDIFEENAKRENYTEVAWAIRQEFLQELEAKGGRSCSGCTRGALIRKYTRKLKELDA